MKLTHEKVLKTFSWVKQTHGLIPEIRKVELASTFVHYFNRGVNRAPIFYETDNFSYLIQGMYRFLPHYKVELVAYCLMPNHYHILLEELEGKQASRFIQRVFNSFTQAMYKRYSRVGTLFQGSAKHTEFLSSEDTATVIGYIHQNPVAAGLVKHPSEWMFSDYNEWAGKTGSARKVVKYRENLFGSLVDYEEFVENFNEKGNLEKVERTFSRFNSERG